MNQNSQERYVPNYLMNKIPNRTSYDVKSRKTYCEGCLSGEENYIPIREMNTREYRTEYDIKQLNKYNEVALQTKGLTEYYGNSRLTMQDPYLE